VLWLTRLLRRIAAFTRNVALDVELIFFQGGTQGIHATLAVGAIYRIFGAATITAGIANADVTMITGYMNTLPL